MQPCDELKNLVLQHYGKFTASGLTEPIRETYSLQKGVTIIAADSKEWFDNRNAILRFIEEGSASKLEIGVENLAATVRGAWVGRRTRSRSNCPMARPSLCDTLAFFTKRMGPGNSSTCMFPFL